MKRSRESAENTKSREGKESTASRSNEGIRRAQEVKEGEGHWREVSLRGEESNGKKGSTELFREILRNLVAKPLI